MIATLPTRWTIEIDYPRLLDLRKVMPRPGGGYFAFTLDQALIIEADGTVSQDRPLRGQGPGEVDFPMAITRTDDGVMVSGHWASAIFDTHLNLIKTVKHRIIGPIAGSFTEDGDLFLLYGGGGSHYGPDRDKAVLVRNVEQGLNSAIIDPSPAVAKNRYFRSVHLVLFAEKRREIVFGDAIELTVVLTDLNGTVLKRYPIDQTGLTPLQRNIGKNPRREAIQQWVHHFDHFSLHGNGLIETEERTIPIITWETPHHEDHDFITQVLGDNPKVHRFGEGLLPGRPVGFKRHRGRVWIISFEGNELFFCGTEI